jgi:hypothetical protein
VTYGDFYDNNLLGCRVVRIPFTAVANNDTFTSGIGSIVAARWDSTDSSDQVCAEVTTQATGVVTFYTSGATSHAGDLVLFCRGY